MDGPDGEPAALPARATAPESVLAEHLAEARRIRAERPEWTDDGGRPALSADFERLRWFALGARQLV